MPNLRRFRRVRLVWLFRAFAFCFCWYVIFSAVRSSKGLLTLCPNDQDCTRAAAAARIWQTVSSGFFPPLLAHPLQEQLGDRGESLMPNQALVFSPLVVIESQLHFLVFKTTLYVPARERHQQQRLHTRFRRRVADEILDFLWLQNVACHDQVSRPAGVAIFHLRIEAYV